MKIRKKDFWYFCFFILAFFSLLNPVFAKKKGKGWNVLLITIDTLRTDRLSCYSSEHVDTPNIDALAQRGVLFKRTFAHTPTTLPSHTNILLGTTPLVHGVHDTSPMFGQKMPLFKVKFKPAFNDFIVAVAMSKKHSF